MLYRGHAATWQEAFATMKRARKYINIQAPQVAMMNRMQAIMEPELAARRAL